MTVIIRPAAVSDFWSSLFSSKNMSLFSPASFFYFFSALFWILCFLMLVIPLLLCAQSLGLIVSHLWQENEYRGDFLMITNYSNYFFGFFNPSLLIEVIFFGARASSEPQGTTKFLRNCESEVKMSIIQWGLWNKSIDAFSCWTLSLLNKSNVFLLHEWSSLWCKILIRSGNKQEWRRLMIENDWMSVFSRKINAVTTLF